MKLLPLVTAFLLSSSLSFLYAMQEKTADSPLLCCNEEFNEVDKELNKLYKENIKEDAMRERGKMSSCKLIPIEPGAPIKSPMKSKHQRREKPTHKRTHRLFQEYGTTTPSSKLDDSCKEPNAPVKPMRKRMRTSTHKPKLLFYKEDSSGRLTPVYDIDTKIFIELDFANLVDAVPAYVAALALFSPNEQNK